MAMATMKLATGPATMIAMRFHTLCPNRVTERSALPIPSVGSRVMEAPSASPWNFT